jgi:glucose 1-dehydrogenase
VRALTVDPRIARSVDVRELADPQPEDDELLVEGLALGICGTDREIASGQYGWAPPGRDRLVLGHESLGRVLRAPADRGFAVGDLVVGIVRRPDPVPCGACAHDEYDMCRNGRYTERGIRYADGYGSTLWTVHPDFAVRLNPGLTHVGVLLEPMSVVAKAWEQVERIGGRAWFEPHRVLVTGAGPIGLLAALLATQRQLDVHVLDRVASGPKPDAVKALGAQYHSAPVADVAERIAPDVIIEATGASSVVVDAIAGTAAYGIVCLTGVSAAGRSIAVDVGAANREIVLENDVVVGSVNANRRHYQAAANALARADGDWLDRLITRRLPWTEFGDTLAVRRPDDIKVVLTLT